MIKTIFHLSSNHLCKSLLFRKRDDYVFFLNRMALLAMESPVKVYAYCLMSNHFHLLAQGEKEGLMELFNRLKWRYSQYLGYNHNGEESSLRDFTPHLRAVTDVMDFRATAAYILRNPQAANVEAALSYKWSSAVLYFNPWLDFLQKETIGSYGKGLFRKILHSQTLPPADTPLLGACIHPAVWCDYQSVEKAFGRSLDYMKALNNWNTERDYEAGEGDEINVYPDDQLSAEVLRFCKEHGATSPQNLPAIAQRQLVRMLHRRFGALSKQIARLTGADDETIRRFS